MTEASNDPSIDSFFISDEDIAGIRDATIDLCRHYQKAYAENGGEISTADVVGELDKTAMHKFFSNYAVLKSMTEEDVLKLDNLDGFTAMGALIQMLEASKYGGK